VVRFAAAVDDPGSWPSKLCPPSLPADRSFEASGGGPQLLRGANLITRGGGVLSSVSFLPWQQKSRSIDSLGAFKDHPVRTSRLLVIRMISASGSGTSGSSCSGRVLCLIAPISIQNPTPVPWFCLCPLAGLERWALFAPSSKHVHNFATGSCPCRQEVGWLGGLWMAYLSRDRQTADR